MQNTKNLNRRDFIRDIAMGTAALSAGGFLLAGCKKGAEVEVSPVEDLMGEHGVLERLLLIFDEASSRMEQGRALPSGVLKQTGSLMRSFIEDYHEKLEEDFLFPRFSSMNSQVDLVRVLGDQHRAGKRVLDIVLSAQTPGRAVAAKLRALTRMLRSHMGWEDTVLFPAFRTMVPSSEYHELGEQFEEKEHKLFGEHGFADTVNRVLAIEKSLGIHELARFTVRG